MQHLNGKMIRRILSIGKQAGSCIVRTLGRKGLRPLVFLLCFAALLPVAIAVDLSPLEQIPVQEGGRKKPYLVFDE